MAVPPVIEISSSPAAQPGVAKSSHRLPTVSASQALFDLQSGVDGHVSTGLLALDSRLVDSGSNSDGGVERGKITELWGPSGAGKTAIALQTAASAIKSGAAVSWIDAATTLSDSRLKSVISAANPRPAPSSLDDTLKSFKHIQVPTLPHLLALIIHPSPDFIPTKAGLLVIDDLNISIDLDYPRQQFTSSTRTEQQKWQSSRRYAMLGSLASALNKLAVLNNVAVIVTTGCSTRMRPDSGLGAALAPGIGGAEWEAGTWNRMVVFRDFGGRLIGMQKCQGKSLISREEVGETGRIFAFEMLSNGVIQDRHPGKDADGATAALAKAKISPVKPRKRTFDEIADSDGEDVDEYGWADADDDALAAEGLVDDGLAPENTTENK